MDRKIVLDTNFLIDLLRFKIGLGALEDFQVFLPQSVFTELNAIAGKKSKEAMLARLALKLVKRKAITLLLSFKAKADEDLVEFARQGYTVATNDRKLREKLKKLGFKTIYLRSKKRIAMG